MLIWHPCQYFSTAFLSLLKVCLFSNVMKKVSSFEDFTLEEQQTVKVLYSEDLNNFFKKNCLLLWNLDTSLWA